MKTRQGFVSNSSSSSFCIIGVHNSDLVWDLMEAEGFPVEKDKDGNRCLPEDVWDNEELDVGYGRWKLAKKPLLLEYYGCDEPYYVGLEAEGMLRSQNIPAAMLEFRRMVKMHLGIDIPEDKVVFHYGEMSSE